ncbi:MAG: hypothetical protein ACI4VX_06220 [Succinivibrionaceae bacterium]
MNRLLLPAALGCLLFSLPSLAGGTFGTKTIKPGFLNSHQTESNCTNAVNKIATSSVTGLYCRLQGADLHIYLALTDEGLAEISQDNNASANLSALQSVFVKDACKRGAFLSNPGANSVQIHLVDKFRQGLLDYTVRRSDCR